MKNILTILLSGLFLCGCSQKRVVSEHSAIDRVQADKDISWHDGYVLHVAKRDGSSLVGIQITGRTSGGEKMTMSADTGTVLPGSIENTADDTCVRIGLNNAITRIEGGGKNTAEKAVFVLHE